MTLQQNVDSWSQTLDHHREWVRSWVADDHDRELFDTDWETKLKVIAAVAANIDSGATAANSSPSSASAPSTTSSDSTVAWQALGVVFGDAICLALGTQWGEMHDEFGVDPGVILDASTETVIFPLTMLSKRVEQGQIIDWPTLLSLFQHVVSSADTSASLNR